MLPVSHRASGVGLRPGFSAASRQAFAESEVSLRSAERIGMIAQTALVESLPNRTSCSVIMPVQRGGHILRSALMPGQSSHSRQVPAPATSNTRVGGENPKSAIEARLMFITIPAEQLTRL
jgi:hypothetical protein